MVSWSMPPPRLPVKLLPLSLGISSIAKMWAWLNRHSSCRPTPLWWLYRILLGRQNLPRRRSRLSTAKPTTKWRQQNSRTIERATRVLCQYEHDPFWRRTVTNEARRLVEGKLTCSFGIITKCLEDFGGGKHHGFWNLILSPFLFL